MAKREYRGPRFENIKEIFLFILLFRKLDAFLDFLHKEIESPIKNISNENEILNLKNNNIIGYFNDKNSLNYKIFVKVANLLRDECQFILLINKLENETNDFISYRSSNGEISNYSNLLNNSEELFYLWSNNKCISLIKEITFENAEQLTDEGLPFMILFHHVNDEQSILLFEKEISKQLIHQKC